MPIVSTFSELLMRFSSVMTAPTFENFVVLATGWILCIGKRALTRAIQAAGAVGLKHYSVYHRFFSRAQWSIDQVSRLLLSILLKFVPNDAPVPLALDDTLCRKRGLHIFGTCMHHDPQISSRKFRLVNWGHSWVVVGILLRFPFAPSVTWCLPFAFRLYISQKRTKSERWKCREIVHKTRPELALDILTMLSNWYPERQFHLYVDSTYGGSSVLNYLPDNFHLTSRITMDAALYEEPQKYAGRGRPRKKGRSLPSPRELAADRRIKWRTLKLQTYGKSRILHIKELVGNWKRARYRRIKIVVVRDPTGNTKDQAFYTTDLGLTAEEILTGYAQRWAIEVAFENGKSHFGFEDPQSRNRKAVERTAPMSLVLYSLVVVWFAEKGHKKCKFPKRPWYTKKATPSFLDIMATLRRESLREYFLNTPEWTQHTRKILKVFCDTLALAA